MRIAHLAVAAAIAAVSCSSGDERAIRSQLSAIATSLTVPANENELGRIARIATLRSALAPDIRVVTGATARPGGEIPTEIVGRDIALGLASRWSIIGGIAVEFVDVQVTIDDAGESAAVYCTAKMTTGTSQQPAVDARELTVAFSKVDGAWRVTSVRPENTLIR